MITLSEAKKIVLEKRPHMKIVNTVELEKCFVISVVPKTYKEDTDGTYIGGGIRVDKKTGMTNLYNPFLENIR